MVSLFQMAGNDREETLVTVFPTECKTVGLPHSQYCINYAHEIFLQGKLQYLLKQNLQSSIHSPPSLECQSIFIYNMEHSS